MASWAALQAAMTPTKSSANDDDAASKPKKAIVFRYDDIEIEQLLGNGAYAKVHMVRHRPTNKRFAAKIFPAKRIKKEKAVSASIERERAALQALRGGAANAQPHTAFVAEMLALLEAPKQDSLIIMEHCKGGLIVDALNKANTHENRMAACKYFIAQLVCAIASLHSVGIIHRDLKPDNLLLQVCESDAVELRLIDFGAAKVVPIEADRSKQRSNSLIGSPSYMPPEILPSAATQKKAKAENGDASFEGDLWSLGCVLYFLACNEELFKGKSKYDIWNAIRAADVCVGSDAAAKLGDDGAALVRALLQRGESDRLGAGDRSCAAIKAHAFFAALDFSDLAKSAPLWLKEIKI